jgi:DNA-binding transcriptional MerR regulator
MGGTASLGHPLSNTASAAASINSETDTGELTISQMSRLFNVSLRTLRFYEDRGLIKPRREGMVRCYRAADRVRMEMILRGKKLGFTLIEISDLIAGKGANETTDIEERLLPSQVAAQINLLERQRSEIQSAIERLRLVNGHLLNNAAA